MKRALWRRLRGRKYREDTAELKSHLDQLVENYIDQGLSRQDAEHAARRRFGNITALQEETREMFSVPVLEHLLQDVRYALRTFFQSPAFTLVAVLTIALGIGATTTVFGVISAVLLQPSPFPNGARLVSVVENVPAQESFTGHAMRMSAMSPQEFEWWRSNSKTIESWAVTLPESRVMSTNIGNVVLSGQRVSPALFAMRGLRPIRGRWLTSNEETSRTRVVVLGADTWRRYFSGSPNIVGRTITLADESFTVVGVIPEAFGNAAFYIPYSVEPPRDGSMQLVSVSGLLKSGISLEIANQEINTLGVGLRPTARREINEDNHRPRFEVVRELDQMVASARPVLTVLVAAVSLVLLIVCANVGNLLLVRGASRTREIRIRHAIGATHGRLVSQLMTEGLVLSIAGGLLGVGLAYIGVQFVRNGSVIDIPARFRNALGPQGADILPRAGHVSIDPTVLVFAFGVSLLSGLLFAVAPALRLARPEHSRRLGGASLGARTGSTGESPRIGRALTVLQIALATILLCGSGLLLRSFIRLSTFYLGLDPQARIFQLVSSHNYPRSRKLNLAYELQNDLTKVPGIDAAGFANLPPLASENFLVNFYLPAAQADQKDSLSEDDKTLVRGVSPDYLQAIGAHLIDGRWLDERDRSSRSRSMLVSRAWARRFSPTKSPVGTTAVFITTGRLRRAITWEIVGVIDDIRWTMKDQQPAQKLPLLGFMDMAQLMDASLVGRKLDDPNMELDMMIGEPAGFAFALRFNGKPLGIEDLRSVVSRLDPGLTVEGLASIGDLYSDLIGRQRFYTVIVNVFGAIAGIIASIGIYGVLAYAMARRTQELGIRLALGAAPKDLLRLILNQGAILIGAGMSIGLLGAAALTRYLSSLLFGLTTLDAVTYVVVTLIFAAMGLLASYVPARRAMKVDPLVALRYE